MGDGGGWALLGLNGARCSGAFFSVPQSNEYPGIKQMNAPIWLILLVIALPFLLVQFCMALSSAAKTRQNLKHSNFFTLFAWIFFIGGIVLIFYLTNELSFWKKPVFVILAFMQGRFIYRFLEFCFVLKDDNFQKVSNIALYTGFSIIMLYLLK